MEVALAHLQISGHIHEGYGDWGGASTVNSNCSLNRPEDGDTAQHNRFNGINAFLHGSYV